MRILSYAALVLLLFALPACDSNEEEPTDDHVDVRGTYALVTVDGQPLPATIDSEGTYESGFVRLEESRVFVNLVIVDASNSSRVEVERGGMYTISGETLTLDLPDGDGRSEVSTATLRANTITISEDELTLVFRK